MHFLLKSYVSYQNYLSSNYSIILLLYLACGKNSITLYRMIQAIHKCAKYHFYVYMAYLAFPLI
ncbi:hypothetical protein LEQ41_01580 [Streptococcus agalactiae]|nr:hypothetical protein [Streptococcus agalactiae]